VNKLKPITKDGVPAALLKAERYRLIGDPSGAESICLDVLAVDPTNQQAACTLLLAITDQMDDGLAEGVMRAREVLPRISDEYKQQYYAGIICERRAKAQLKRGGPRSHEIASEWLREAMTHYERAEANRPSGDDGAILRWNTCARILDRNEKLHPPGVVPDYEPSLE
jgi:hypothetical protein